MLETEVCVVGSGPGGTVTALRLNQLGVPCLLLDKAFFPRDKVCGDAISGKAITIFNRIDSGIISRFQLGCEKEDIWGMRLVAPNQTEVDLPFKFNVDKQLEPVPGFVSPRYAFDNFLVSEVQRHTNIDFRQGIKITRFEKTGTGFILSDEKNSFRAKTKLLIVANGAQSNFSRKIAGIPKEPRHYAGAVRAYVENVTGFHPDGYIELHFPKEYIPGYFWAFPLPEGRANIGLGLRTDYISKRKLNLKTSLLELIRNHPNLKERFSKAVIRGEVTGYPLPLGSKKYPLSGDHFMLVGDAGHLIDPLTGEGIGNAAYSGWIAADQAKKCLDQGDFSASFLLDYDVRVERVLGSEMQLSYQLQKLLAYPWLLNFFANRLHNSQKFMGILSQMYADFELRKQLIHPSFWMKMLLNTAK